MHRILVQARLGFPKSHASSRREIRKREDRLKGEEFERARAKKPFLPLLRWCAAPDENVGAKVGAVRPYHSTALTANLGK